MTKRQKVMLALPCGTGMLPSQVCESITKEVIVAYSKGIEIYPCFLNYCSRVEVARNWLVSEFYAGDYTDLVFVDTDQAWNAGEICRLLEYQVDVVGAVARMKREPEEYRLNWLGQDEAKGKPFTVTKDDNGLIEVESIGTCFMRITRKVITKLITDHPELEYKWDGTIGVSWALFWPALENKTCYGEDISFCKLVRKAGFKIYLDPTVILAHIGQHAFVGSVEDYFRRKHAKS